MAVALSGGVDSAVTAAILKRQRYLVIGLHFRTGPPFFREELARPDPLQGIHSDILGHEPPARGRTSGAWTGPVNPWVARVAEHIGVPLEVVDCSEAFETEVIRYFIDTYCSARTPNPCMVCNARVKFRVLLERAKALGASGLATGHYARVRKEADGKFCLLKGKDGQKDQSYFLARLNQQQLSSAVFPLGGYTKTQTRRLAGELGLASCVAPESQELCFVRDENYKKFLVGSARFVSEAGPIVDTTGRTLGRHQGLHAYTVGQRKGIGIPGAAPYYVIRLDKDENRLVVGRKAELAVKELLVTDINWIEGNPPGRPISARTRIRYRHKEAESIVRPVDPHTATVEFSKAEYAVTPGQAAVFYDGERVLGGGWIA